MPRAGSFVLKPEWQGPCARSATIDVNLGHTPEAFVNAAHYQITGEPAPPALVRSWSERLRRDEHVRRIDVVRALCDEQRRPYELTYSDPWLSQPVLEGAPERRVARDVGAVFMFFFGCPGGVNCEMNWANTHALGMNEPHALFAFESAAAGFYAPSEPGFWRRELLEAEYAGLQFLLLNVYGPDIQDGKLSPLASALSSLRDPIKLALFDDTWSWDKPWFGRFLETETRLQGRRSDRDVALRRQMAAVLLLDRAPPLVPLQGPPADLLLQRGYPGTARVLGRGAPSHEGAFSSRFGEEPFWPSTAPSSRIPRCPASRIHASSGSPSPSPTERAVRHCTATSRSRNGQVGCSRQGSTRNARQAGRLVVKGPKLLERVLRESLDAELLVLATWNDLGEGTGIHRNYDYYAGGRWLEPDHFMRLIRESQSGIAR